MRAVADDLAVDEDRHVFAQPTLVIEHVAARLRVVGKHGVQNLAHVAALRFRFRAGDVALDIGRERDLGHRGIPSVVIDIAYTG